VSLDRRQFLKLSSALVGAAAVAGYGGSGLLNLASQSAGLALRIPGSGAAEPSSSEAMGEDLQVPHLLRRAGFGASPQELAAYKGMGFDVAVQTLLDFAPVEASKESYAPAPPPIRLTYSGRPVDNELYVLAEWWLYRMARTSTPLQEKMTLFWHNHFATGYTKVQNGYLMYKQNELLRANALGNFRDLLTDITSDGAMLVWLDGNANGRANPNENYSREVMEVFTTGRGPYTETDVQEGARIFTGYSVGADGGGVFHPDQHDDGIKTYLGNTGNLGIQDAIDVLVARPETAANLSTELFQFLAHPNPSSEMVGKLSALYFENGYEIKPMVEAILTSDEFVSQQAYLANVKSPAEFVATALRSTGATATPLSAAASMDAQGQSLLDPPSVFGWPSGSEWINAGSMVERINFPLNILTSAQDPASGFDLFRGSEVGSAVRALSLALFPDGMPEELLKVVQASTAETPGRDFQATNAIRLTMSTPFYNLN